jgi:hypothetical protein
MNDALQQINRHLSEDELDEFLMGFGSPAAAAHLSACEPCGVRLTDFEQQVAAFNQASLKWSQARSNSISRDLAAHKLTPRLTLTTAWSSAAALVLALAFGFTAIVQHNSGTLEAANASTGQVAPVSAEQSDIASDNAMLAAIGSEINTPQPTRFSTDEAATSPQRRASSPQVRD